MRILMTLFGGVLLASPATADVIKSAPDHFTLKQEGISALSPDDLWNRLIDPASWWHPDHSYSGKSEHFSLDLKAGGLWLEKWDGGAVAHGEVLYFKNGEQLRLDAPFGPLQEIGVKAVWTITLSPHEDGTRVVFDEIVNGTEHSGLDKLAPAVDYVKTEAMSRLISGEDFSINKVKKAD